MPKGHKTDNETIYKIMCLYAIHNNYSEVGRILNVPRKTVEKLVKEHINDEEFAQICQEKKDEFIESANRIINKGTKLLESRLDTAIENHEELDDLIYEIYNAPKEEIKDQQKKALVNKVMKLQVNSLSEITTAIGTLFDKKIVMEKGNTPDVVIPELKVKVVDNSGLEKYMYEEEE